VEDLIKLKISQTCLIRRLKNLFDQKANNRIVQKLKYPNPIRTTIAKQRERIDLFKPFFEPYSLYFGYLNTGF